MAVLPKLIYKFSAIPAGFFAEIDKLILKSIWKFKGSIEAKTILKKNKVGRLKFSDFKTYYKGLLWWHSG